MFGIEKPFFFQYYFLIVYQEVIALHCNKSLFWEGKKIQNVAYKFKASWLLSKLLNFLPKLRRGALETKLFISIAKMYEGCFYFITFILLKRMSERKTIIALMK